MQDSRTPRFVEHFWVPISGASCSSKLFVGTLRPSHSILHKIRKTLVLRCITLRLHLKLLSDFNFRVLPKGGVIQRVPRGVEKKRGVENLTNDTPPKKGFGPTSYGTFSTPPSGASALFFLYKNPRQSRPEALLKGPKIFGRARSLVRCLPPHTFCTPPYHGPVIEGGGYKR